MRWGGTSLSGNCFIRIGTAWGAANYAEFLPERKKMMQGRADYLDAVKTGAKIIPITAKARLE
jgi:hypothetical protein